MMRGLIKKYKILKTICSFEKIRRQTSVSHSTKRQKDLFFLQKKKVPPHMPQNEEKSKKWILRFCTF